jgi:lysophospholipase L1-like esterase
VFAGLALALAALAGCSGGGPKALKSVDMSAVTQDLESLSAARILLGHQSVGRDVLAGVRTLAQEAGVALRVEQIDGLPPDDQAGLFHSNIGENGDPDSKCEVFSHLLTRPERPAYDLALMKFCYVDLDSGTPMTAEQMIDRYERMVRQIREDRPDVRLVHITVPLKADPPGKKTRLKRLLGMATERDAANDMRNRFNDALRERFAGEPIFDIAAMESTYADGSRSAFKYQGRTVYSLAPEHTHDGGHLNEAAQRIAAAQFLRTLAEALPRAAQEEALTDARGSEAG